MTKSTSGERAGASSEPDSATRLLTLRDLEFRRQSLQPLLGPSVIHEIREHCAEIRGVVGVGFQIVPVFVQGGGVSRSR